MKKLCIIFLFTLSIAKGQDTIFVSVDNTVYLTFPDKIELVDIGKFEEYVAEVSNDNLVKVKAINANSKTSTLMVKYGTNFKQLFLQVVDNPKRFHYDFRLEMVNSTSNNQVEKSTISSTTSTKTESNTQVNNVKPEQKEVLEKCLKVSAIQNEEFTLGFISKFLQASVTVIRNDKNNTYFKIALNNKSSLPYRFDFISFQYFQSMNKGFGKQKRKAPQDVYPVLENNNQEVPPLTMQNVVFVIPSFALANNGYLLINFREKEGDRVMKIKITSDKIQSAGIIN